ERLERVASQECRLYHETKLSRPQFGVVQPNLPDQSANLLSRIHATQVTVQPFVQTLSGYPYGPVQVHHFDLVPFPVRPEPLDRLEEYFFLMSIPYSFSASSIIFSRKSIWICF